MPRDFVSVPAEGGDRFDALIVPSPGGRAPGIVMLSEIFGINEQMRAAAEQWADAGFAVLVPDLFWRQQRRVDLAYEGEGRARAFALYRPYDYQRGVRDVAASLEALRARPECNGMAAVIGYCFGGTLAWLAAARCDPDAAVSFYGTQIDRYLAEAAAVRCPVSLHIGDADAHVSPDAIATTQAAVAENPLISFHLYRGVGHAFMNPARLTFDRGAAALAIERTSALLDEALPPTSRGEAARRS